MEAPFDRFRDAFFILKKSMYGLRVNVSKSFFIPIGEVPELNHLAQSFGYGVELVIEYLPSSYFGLPLGVPYKCKAVWEPMTERFTKRLTRSKSKPFVWRGLN